jgi:hypothetical protein
VIISADSILCNGNTSNIRLAASGGTGACTYSFNFSAYSTQTKYSTKAGTFKYAAKDSVGCLSSNFISLTQPVVFKVTASAPAVKCFGGASLITLQGSGGISPYTFMLNDTGLIKGSYAVFKNVPAGGPYNYVAKDFNNCQITGLINVTQPAALTATVIITSPTCATINNGILTVNASGGTEPYLYKLNNGIYAGSNRFPGLAPGTYTTVVKDSNNCAYTISNIKIVKPTNTCFATYLINADKSAKENDNLVVKVYPNPTVTNFTILLQHTNLMQPLEVRVIDINGKIVYKAVNTKNYAYTFGEKFASGIYIAEILSNNNVQRYKLVKM